MRMKMGAQMTRLQKCGIGRFRAWGGVVADVRVVRKAEKRDNVTYESVFGGAFSPWSLGCTMRNGVVLHVEFKVCAIVDAFDSQFDSWACYTLARIGMMDRRRTILDAHRRQDGTVTQYRALEQKRVSGKMILRAEVDFVGTFFERLRGKSARPTTGGENNRHEEYGAAES
jgi:hypothetical protein